MRGEKATTRAPQGRNSENQNVVKREGWAIGVKVDDDVWGEGLLLSASLLHWHHLESFSNF